MERALQLVVVALASGAVVALALIAMGAGLLLLPCFVTISDEAAWWVAIASGSCHVLAPVGGCLGFVAGATVSMLRACWRPRVAPATPG